MFVFLEKIFRIFPAMVMKKTSEIKQTNKTDIKAGKEIKQMNK